MEIIDLFVRISRLYKEKSVSYILNALQEFNFLNLKKIYWGLKISATQKDIYSVSHKSYYNNIVSAP